MFGQPRQAGPPGMDSEDMIGVIQPFVPQNPRATDINRLMMMQQDSAFFRNLNEAFENRDFAAFADTVRDSTTNPNYSLHVLDGRNWLEIFATGDYDFKWARVVLDAKRDKAKWSQYVGNTGNTALHLFAKRGDPEAVRYLMERGAKLDVRNRDGMTPIMVAARDGNSARVVELMLVADSPLYMTSNGKTPMDFAIRRTRIAFANWFALDEVKRQQNRHTFREQAERTAREYFSTDRSGFAQLRLN